VNGADNSYRAGAADEPASNGNARALDAARRGGYTARMGRARTAAFVAAWALAACARTAETPLKLAVIAPASGALAADGEGMRRAVTLAIEEERAETGPGRRVEALELDDRGDPAAAADAARRAAADPAVFAVIGPMTSGCAIEAARVLSLETIPMITPSATAAELTLQQESPQWKGARVVFRLPPSDAVQGDSDAEYALRRLGLKKMAVIHDGTPYGLGLAEAFRRGFESRGGVVSFFTQIPRGGDDFSSASGQLAVLRPDGVFYGGVYIEAGKLLKAARGAGFKGAFFSGDGAKSDDFFRYAGDAADGAYLSVSGTPPELLPGAADFIARYRKRWADAAPRTFDHYAYEAARIALWSMRKTGGDRAAEIEAIRAETHDTFVGTFIFDAKGDSLKSVITMLKADGRARRFETAY
jgi:branched-chain amino acid transport system substrate-binding protein